MKINIEELSKKSFGPEPLAYFSVYKEELETFARLIVKRYAVGRAQAQDALELIASPIRPDGTWNRDREACRDLAAKTLAKLQDWSQ